LFLSKPSFSFVAIMILLWDLNLAGVLVSMGMEMEMEKEKEAILWDGGLYGWMDAWLGCAIPLGCFWLELCGA
jgi:hypothetical protein